VKHQIAVNLLQFAQHCLGFRGDHDTIQVHLYLQNKEGEEIFPLFGNLEEAQSVRAVAH
jgi:hypothetical protein